VRLEADVRARIGAFALSCGLSVDAGSTIALVGQSGAGKTSMLRAIAGLLRPREGRITCGDVWFDAARNICVPPQRRNCGMVFAEYALFAHLSALENAAFGLRALDAAPDVRRRAYEYLEAFGVAPLSRRRAGSLSSGEQQRVALARALATSPAALLLDEPLSAIDVERRAPVRETLLRFIRESGAAAVIVTHEPVEAMLFAERLIVLERGEVVQQGSAADLREHPRTSYVASFFGTNLFFGLARAGEGDTSVVAVNGAALYVMGSWSGHVALVIDPDAVVLSRVRPDSSARNVLRGPVTEIAPDGAAMRVVVASRPRIIARVTRQSVAELAIAPGESVFASFKAAEVSVY
jgi:molybdate transport system ATP-binding protein